MRFRRFSLFAGLAVTALLAVAGFAAFGNLNPTAQEVRVEAASASMGHTSGAYAGLAFAVLGPTVERTSLDVPEGYLDPTLSELTVTQIGEQANAAAPVEEKSSHTGWLSEVEVRALIELYFKPEDVNRAVRVAWCESRFDPESVNRKTGGVGLFQHLPRYWTERAASAGFFGSEATDAEASTAAAAWAVYNEGGWDTFSCRG